MNKDFEYIKNKFDKENVKAPETLSEDKLMQKLDGARDANIIKLAPSANRRGLKAAVAAVACFAIVAGSLAVGGVFGRKSVAPKSSGVNTAAVQLTGVNYFTSYADINEAIRSRHKDRFGRGGLYITNEVAGYSGAKGIGAATDDAQVQAPAAANNASHAETNRQVDAVDEADIIKTDSGYIYYGAQYESIKIYSADNGKTKLVSEIKLGTGRSLTEFFLDGDRIIAIGSSYETKTRYAVMGGKSKTFVYTYDITDRANPVLVDEYEQDGFYISSRMIGSTVYIVSRYANYFYYLDYYGPVLKNSDTVDEGEATSSADDAEEPDFSIDEDYDDLDEDLDGEDSDEDIDGDSEDEDEEDGEDEDVYEDEDEDEDSEDEDEDEDETEYIPCATGDDGEYDILPVDDICEVDGTDDDSYTLIGAIDTADGSHAKKTKAIIGCANDVYCNEKNLYLAGTVYNRKENSFELLSTESELLKYTLDGTKIELTAAGRVDGWINDQFSFDEKDGMLRVATTSTDKKGTETNNLFVLDESLSVIGEVSGFAKDESIKSVRYIGNTAYVVTFVETDPLFVIDLSNPKQPEIKGEVKLDGFSTFLYPIDDTTLLGVGYSTSEEEFGVVTDGIKLVTFDVSDSENPKVLSELVIPDADSPAQYTHKAIVRNPEAGYFAIPIEVWNWEEDESETEYKNGALLFTVKDGKLEIKDNFEVDEDIYPERCTYIGDYLYIPDAFGNSIVSFEVK